MQLRNALPALVLGLLVVPADHAAIQSTGQYRFEIETLSVTDLTELGQGEIESTANLMGVLSVEVTDDESVTIVLDTLGGSSEGQGQQLTQDILQGAWGASWSGRLDEKGRLTDLESASESPLATQIESNILRGLFPYIVDGASAGDTWSDTLMYSRRDSTSSQESTTYIDYTAGADTTVAGTDAMIVRSTYASSSSGYQEAQGGLDIEGESEGTGVHFIAEGGRYLGGVREVESELEVSGAAIPAVIPVMVSTTLSVELVQ